MKMGMFVPVGDRAAGTGHYSSWCRDMWQHNLLYDQASGNHCGYNWTGHYQATAGGPLEV